jgi:multidrug efflux pump subunit AcrA (membrane-fusion protein)
VVEASIENGDNALRPGMFATARITREGGTTGIFIPKAAVYNDQATQSYRAFVIVEGIAKLRVTATRHRRRRQRADNVRHSGGRSGCDE